MVVVRVKALPQGKGNRTNPLSSFHRASIVPTVSLVSFDSLAVARYLAYKRRAGGRVQGEGCSFKTSNRSSFVDREIASCKNMYVSSARSPRFCHY